MREIKFRGYSKEYKTMFDYDYIKKASDAMVKICQKFIDDNEIDSIPISTGLFIPTDDKDMVLMQYTGLKDKNGKEIYEGDVIIKRPLLITGEYSNSGFAGVVKFDECSFWVENKNTTYLLWLDYEEAEVLGNIYENKDLLEVSNE